MATNAERAILAGGCFWGMQQLIRRRPGVLSTRVGYSGGDVPNATYRNHCTHAEAIEIVFNPDEPTYWDLLEFFFQIPDQNYRKSVVLGTRVSVRVDIGGRRIIKTKN